MSWAGLAEEIWEQISPHIAIDKVQECAQALIEKFEDHDVDEWEYDSNLWQSAYPDECDDEDEDVVLSSLLVEVDEETAQLSPRGADLVREMHRAATYANASLMDLVYCFSEEEDDIHQLDAYCMGVLSDMNTILAEYASENPPTPYPEDLDDDDTTTMGCAVLLVCYGVMHSFEPGGSLEFMTFEEYMTERP